jgi:hypothetical protein
LKASPVPRLTLRADDTVAAVEAVLDAEHVHRAAFALRDAGLAPRQLGHDDLGIDAVGEHVAMIAITGDDAVFGPVERRLQPDRYRFLADIEVTEAADQAEAVKLPRALLEAADEQHLAVEFEQFVAIGAMPLRFGRAFAVRRRRRLRCLRSRCFGHGGAGPSLCFGSPALWRESPEHATGGRLPSARDATE